MCLLYLRYNRQTMKEKTSKESRYKGIRGWLLVFILVQSVGLAIYTALFVVALIVSYLADFKVTGESMPTPLIWVRIEEVTTILALLIVVVLLSKIRIAPLLTKIYMAVSILINFVALFLLPIGSKSIYPSKTSLALHLSYSVIWFLYFSFPSVLKLRIWKHEKLLYVLCNLCPIEKNFIPVAICVIFPLCVFDLFNISRLLESLVSG